ncbi:MAG: TIGR01212 family radical SAM protein [Bacteroidales bacterium]
MAKGYYDFGEFLKKHFGYKVQKIAVNAGFTCPNRDGSKGVGGCTYCNNQTFNPEYCSDNLSVTEQLERGKGFFAKKYSEMKYLAYFQAYTNTYADVQYLKKLYTEALAVDGVVGIIIGTRPDCMSQELLEYLQELSKRVFVLVEYGVESSNNDTLRIINRGHTWEDTVDAIHRTVSHNIMCGVHIILGLPNEGEVQIIETARKLSQLPIVTAKLHQLQLIKGTKMAAQVANGELEVAQWSAAEYIDICMEFIRNLSPTIAIERFVSQSPEELLISPRWGLKNYQFSNLLNNRIAALDIIQGSAL